MRYVVVCGAAFLFFAPSTYAQQSCDACSTTPPELEKYFVAMDTLLELLPVSYNADAEVATGNTSPQGAIISAATLVQQVYQIILTPQTDINVYDELQMTERAASLRRDRKRLEATKQKIVNRIFAHVGAKQHIVAIPTDVAQKIDTILQDELGYLSLIQKNGDYELVNQAEKYRTYAIFLWQLHLMYEYLHMQQRYDSAFYTVGQAYQKSQAPNVEDAIQEAETNTLTSIADNLLTAKQRFLAEQERSAASVNLLYYVQFKDQDKDFMAHVWEIQDEYACSVGIARNMCLSDRQAMRKDIAHLFKERVVNDADRAINTFLTAWGRLRGALGIGSEEDQLAAQQRQTSLVERYRGTPMDKDSFWDLLEARSVIEPSPVWPQALMRTIRKAFRAQANKTIQKKQKQDTAAGSTDTTAQADTQPAKDKYPTLDDKKDLLWQERIMEQVAAMRERIIRYDGLIGENKKNNERIARFRASFEGVLDLQKELTVQSAFTDVHTVTRKYPIWSKMIYENMQLLGKKNPSSEKEGGLYYAMSQVCELQCQNIDDKVCEHFGN